MGHPFKNKMLQAAFSLAIVLWDSTRRPQLLYAIIWDWKTVLKYAKTQDCHAQISYENAMLTSANIKLLLPR